MKTLYFFILAINVVILTGCGVSTTSEESSQAHYQGESCARCHSASSDEGEDSFSSGATIFKSIDASNGDVSNSSENYSLRLVLENGAGIENYRLGNGTGNVNASFNAGIAKYTAEVLDSAGNLVNSSVQDSHDASRFDCNSCHTASGLNGAPGRIVSFNYATSITSTTDTNTTTTATPMFANDVEPILTNNCAVCHGNSGNFSITINTPYTGTMQFVDTITPANSLILQKGSGNNHGGGVQLSTSEYTTVYDWIVAGALNN